MQVDYICLSDGKSPKREKTNGIDVTRLPLSHQRGGKFGYFKEYSFCVSAASAILAKRNLQRRYDLIYINNMPDTLVAAALVPKWTGAKVVLDMHDPMPELMETIFGLNEKSFAVRTIKRLEKWSMARAHRVIVVNEACKRVFGGRSCSPEKMSVVMNTPDEAIFTFRPAGSYKTRSKDSEEPFVLMYHGSMVERNGVDLAIEAVGLLRKSVPNAVLRIYGHSTPFLEAAIRRAEDHGFAGAIQHLGPKKLGEIVQAIGECDLGVIPNHRSAFADLATPTRVLEYLSQGKPLIAPRTPGVTDYFDDDSLLYFESGNATDLARQIELAASEPENLMQTAIRGQQVYMAHRWEQEREALSKLIADLL